MSLVTLRELLPAARKQKRAVGAFNVANYETAVSAIRAAEGEKLPIIIQLYTRLFQSDKAHDLAGMVIRMAERASQPVALHLDHGDSVGQVERALKWGCSSVMFDGSRLPYEENVRLTRRSAELANAANASCEGEIGHVAMGDESALTVPEEAEAFALATKVDALAVSIGTVHGFYRSEPKLDIARCRAIADRLPEVPLVLHGGSGTPPGELRKAIENGVAKINIATEFQHTFLKSVGANVSALDGKFAPLDKVMEPVIDECAAFVARLLRLFAGLI